MLNVEKGLVHSTHALVLCMHELPLDSAVEIAENDAEKSLDQRADAWNDAVISDSLVENHGCDAELKWNQVNLKLVGEDCRGLNNIHLKHID